MGLTRKSKPSRGSFLFKLSAVGNLFMHYCCSTENSSSHNGHRVFTSRAALHCCPTVSQKSHGTENSSSRNGHRVFTHLALHYATTVSVNHNH